MIERFYTGTLSYSLPWYNWETSMKILLFFVAIVAVAGLFFRLGQKSNFEFQIPTTKNLAKPAEKPLDKYTYENLAKTKFLPSKITFGESLGENQNFKSHLFFFEVEGKKISGLANVPNTPGTYPVVILFRGYVDRENYQTGVGSQRVGEFFAQNDFITLAPDFLGYGQSDDPSASPIEERFQTYITALTLLESTTNLNETLAANNLAARAKTQKIAIWGHSNGGQIALTVLETTGKNFPTVLWAPVSKPFPYSTLYYTDDFDDHGKKLRKVVADFEKDYDAQLYSLTNYLQKINAPIQLHQGEADESVPLRWSNQLFDELGKLEKEVTYFKYSGADHNLSGSWKLAASRSLEFFNSKLQNQ